jgi:hypothetical protein
MRRSANHWLMYRRWKCTRNCLAINLARLFADSGEYLVFEPTFVQCFPYPFWIKRRPATVDSRS